MPGRRVFLVILLWGISTHSPAVEKEFCTVEICAPDALSVRFGARNGPSELELPRPAVGHEFEVFITADVVSDIQAFAIGAAIDPDQLEILEVTIGADITALSPIFDNASAAVGLEEIEVDPNLDPRRFGIVFVALFPVAPFPGVTLPKQESVLLGTAHMRVKNSTSPIRIEFVDNLIPNPGAPPARTNYTIGALSIAPRIVNDGLLTGGEKVMKFSRGDVTGDTSINITDAAILIQNIFFNRIVRFDCQDMMDVDDDGQLSATDPIVILRWMFLGANHPAAPFQACDTDPSMDSLECLQSNCET